MRDGVWWQQHGGQWYRWNPGSNQWELGAQPSPPAPPAPPPGPAATQQPVRAYTGSGKPLDELSAGDTWSSVTIGTDPDPDSDWPEGQALQSTKRAPQTKLAVLGFVALTVAVLFGAYTYFFSGNGAPSDEDIDAAFATVKGYEYQHPPDGFQDQIDAALEEVPMVSDYVSGFDMRMIERRNQVVGAVAVMGYEPGQFGDEDLDPRDNEAFMMGFNRSSGMNLPAANLKTVTRGNTTMYEVKAAGATVVMFVNDDKGLIFSIATTDVRSARKISQRLALANQ
jgi:hypothetical protein